MKITHYLVIGLLVVGALYVWHTYSQHGGVKGFKSGLGVGH